MKTELGIAGRIAAAFQNNRLTPLLALVALLLGVFAVLVTPREEEPQIDVTMAQVFVAWPGATVADVETQVATPAERVLSQMAGVEHVMSLSRPGLALVAVQFKVGVPRQAALVRLFDTLNANSDWLPQGLGVMPPVVKARGIDDVPIVTLTLHGAEADSLMLEQVAHGLEVELKRVPGTREIKTVGAPGRAVRVQLDPARLAAAGVTVSELRQALQGAQAGGAVGELLRGAQTVQIEAGPFLASADEAGELVVASRNGRPVLLRDVATLTDGPPPASRYVWHTQGKDEHPAVTLAITKKAGENAIDVARAVLARVDAVRNTLIPAGVQLAVTRNYGATADDKATKLIQKLLFATASVVALVALALGRREALIVGIAVGLTLTATLFASWAWGFTLNRVSLFALIFSIGILVDDAIVVVENIHRHQQLSPGKPLFELIPGAVAEVGGPTILATLTVIAALLPMAFVSGLMGPYMGPIPINASLGMAISLAVAFVLTPWLAARLLKSQADAHTDSHGGRVDKLFHAVFDRLLHPELGRRWRRLLWAVVAGLIAISMLLPVLGAVVLKMLPFDNKSEFQVVVDLPAGSPVEATAGVLRELSAHLATVPEVQDLQAYAGTASPINFNGLVRQYELRQTPERGDLQVNLVGSHDRKLQSHAIATRERPALQAIAARHGAKLKVVEVPPGPPVLAPLVAEVYGPDAAGRRAVAAQVREALAKVDGVVDTDVSAEAPSPRALLAIDRRKAAALGVPASEIVATLRASLGGEDVAWLREGSFYPVPLRLQGAPEAQGDLDALLQLRVRSSTGALVPLRELVQRVDGLREQPVWHKDLMPVEFVVGDTAGAIDSPLYGMAKARAHLAAIKTPDGQPVAEHFIRQPADGWRGYSLKWDGEWQITYETFRDMGAAYAVGLVLIYLLVVAQFKSYLTPLIIMAPIPLTIIGVMPGHALLGANFTATSMIGMIALAGIIVRNSILLVDFVNLQLREGVPFAEAIRHSAIARARPIVLTGLAAMGGALFILSDPIFNGLAISLVFGIAVSTVLTLVVIPTLYYVAYRNRLHVLQGD
jgi:multidrug efflux pump subunit AcrB